MLSFAETSFEKGLREEYTYVKPKKMTEQKFDTAYANFRIKQDRMTTPQIQILPTNGLLRSEMDLESLNFFNLLWANEI